MSHAARRSIATRANTSSDAQTRLRTIARGIADAYVAHTAARAVLLTGSVGEGLADELSDIDLIVYYDVLPPEHAIARAHAQIGIAVLERTAYGASFRVGGVECEVGHFLVDETERRLATVSTITRSIRASTSTSWASPPARPCTGRC